MKKKSLRAFGAGSGPADKKRAIADREKATLEGCLSRTMNALAPLDEEQRRRVLRAVVAFYDLELLGELSDALASRRHELLSKVKP